MTIILLIISAIAVGVFLITYIINIGCVIYVYGFKNSSKMFYETLLNLDIFGCREFRCFFNLSMITKKGYQFGKVGETISSVLEKNKLTNTLSWFGLFWYYLLYIVDIRYWKKGGHCYNSIM